MKSKLAWLLLLLTGCATQTTARSHTPSASAVEEMKVALLDVRQAFSAQQMDIQLLEEKVAKLSPKAVNASHQLEDRVKQLEKTQENLISDLHQLSQHANQTSSSFAEYKKQLNALDKMLQKQNEKLNEVVKLRGTLDTISKTLTKGEASGKSYTVRSGDSLEKLARRFHTDVKTLKEMNHLSSNTIIIGQELKIP